MDSDNAAKTIILFVILIIILGIVFFLVFRFKPASMDIDPIRGDEKDTAQEHINTIENLTFKVYNLTKENILFDELFDELVYTEAPESDRICEFVSNYHDFASLYIEDKKKIQTSELFSKDLDSTDISLDRQQKFLESSVVALLKSIADKKKILISIPVAFPIAEKDAQIVSGFGMREHPVLNEPRMHTGIDIKAPVGTPVMATANGKVIETREQIGTGYGQPCIIEHKFGYQSLYGHLVRLEVFKNQIVQKGQVIGRVGDTGLSQGPHLHYEIRKNGKSINPSYLIFEGLTLEEYKNVVKLGTQ